jgi:hypothetical protein
LEEKRLNEVEEMTAEDKDIGDEYIKKEEKEEPEKIDSKKGKKGKKGKGKKKGKKK